MTVWHIKNNIYNTYYGGIIHCRRNNEQSTREGNDGRVKEGGQGGISCRVSDNFSGYRLHSWWPQQKVIIK